MYPCAFCEYESADIKHLRAHTKCRHSNMLVIGIFRCKQKECLRSFSTIHSYEKHLINKHPVADVAKQITNPYAFDTIILPSPSVQELAVNNTDPPVTIADFARTVDEYAVSFVAKQYANQTMPRALVHKLIIDIANLYKEHLQILRRTYISFHPESSENLDNLLNILKNVFTRFKTEFRTLRYFVSLGTLSRPKTISVGAIICPRRIRGLRRMQIAQTTIQVISLKSVLKTFLTLPNVLNSIISHMDQLTSSDIISSIIQCDVWRKIEQRFGDELVLPLILYYDDFEINNPLGSHRGINKLGAVYCSIASLPHEYGSMLENIFLSQLHNSRDHSRLGNKIIFAGVIDQMKDLETNGVWE